MPDSRRPPPLPALALMYLLVFSASGITLPWLPAHLRALGLSGSDIGAVMAAYPLALAFVPPLWGFVADRTRQASTLLSIALLGYLLAFVPLLRATDRAAIAPWLGAAAFFGSPLSLLIDSQVLDRLRATPERYAHTRMWGSVGFILAATGFGLFYSGERSSPPPVIVAVLVALGVSLLASLFVRGGGSALQPPSMREGLALLGDRRLRLLLLVTALHWLAMAPYNLLFAVHVRDLGLPSAVAGLGVGLGVLAEVGVMALFPRLGGRVAPARLLAFALGVTAVRWVLMALVADAVPMVLLQLFHGLTFGAFYLAAITYLTGLVPPRLRATGQALFVSVTFGLGGVAGYLLVGRVYDALGPRDLYFGAALLQLLPAVLATQLPSLERSRPSAASTDAPPTP